MVLAEAARQRLLQLAADVLGRMAAEEMPASLRPIAKFTAQKRQRLGAPALAAALDADAEFRARVAEVVAESAPQLAEAIRDGMPTGASDPLDVAVVAYLTRPDGWREVITEVNARRAGERDRGESAAQNSRLRAEVSELRSRLKADTARVRETLAAAGAAASAEIAELKRQARVRAGELGAAERGRLDALAALAEVRQEAQSAASAREAELRRARARIAELERALESARRSARTDRDVDDARLWLLVDTLTGAAAGIRRELSLPAPALRPADTVDGAVTAAAHRSVDDTASFDRLLALPNVHLIIDGYNVTKTGYGELPLAAQRTRLVSSLAALAARGGTEITVAFDGGVRPPAQPPAPRGVRVLFSEAGEIADDLIRRLVAAEPQRPLVVVTSDREILTDMRRAGAWTVPSAVLVSRLA